MRPRPRSRSACLISTRVINKPSFVVDEDIAAGRLVPVLTKYQPLEADINAYYLHRQLMSAKVRVFIDLLADHFGKERDSRIRHKIPT